MMVRASEQPVGRVRVVFTRGGGSVMTGCFEGVKHNGDYYVEYESDKPLDANHEANSNGKYPRVVEIRPDMVIEWPEGEPAILNESATIELKESGYRDNGRREKPVYAVKKGSRWIGVNHEMEQVTRKYSTKKSLEKAYDGDGSKGVGSKDGEKIYQIHYPV